MKGLICGNNMQLLGLDHGASMSKTELRSLPATPTSRHRNTSLSSMSLNLNNPETSLLVNPTQLRAQNVLRSFMLQFLFSRCAFPLAELAVLAWLRRAARTNKMCSHVISTIGALEVGAPVPDTSAYA